MFADNILIWISYKLWAGRVSNFPATFPVSMKSAFTRSDIHVLIVQATLGCQWADKKLNVQQTHIYDQKTAKIPYCPVILVQNPNEMTYTLSTIAQ